MQINTFLVFVLQTTLIITARQIGALRNGYAGEPREAYYPGNRNQEQYEDISRPYLYHHQIATQQVKNNYDVQHQVGKNSPYAFNGYVQQSEQNINNENPGRVSRFWLKKNQYGAGRRDESIPGKIEAPGLQEAPGLREAPGSRKGSGPQEASGLQEAPALREAPGSQEVAGPQEAPGLKEASEILSKENKSDTATNGAHKDEMQELSSEIKDTTKQIQALYSSLEFPDTGPERNDVNEGTLLNQSKGDLVKELVESYHAIKMLRNRLKIEEEVRKEMIRFLAKAKLDGTLKTRALHAVLGYLHPDSNSLQKSNIQNILKRVIIKERIKMLSQQKRLQFLKRFKLQKRLNASRLKKLSTITNNDRDMKI